ncbi:MAG: hypothetical protein AB7T19_20780, partial [Planctomycetota bacterium]
MTFSITNAAVTALAALAGTFGLCAQDLGVKAAPQDKPVLIEHAQIHLGTGEVLDDAALWFRDGRIGAVGKDAASTAPADCERIDANGLQLWPGFVDAVCQIGVLEIGSVSATADVAEIGDVTPEAVAAVAVNPDATNVPVTRSNGVLVAGIFPEGGLIAGHASTIALDGWTSADMTLRERSGLVIEWPPLPDRSQADRRGDRDRQEPSGDDPRLMIDRIVGDAIAWRAARNADPTVPMDIRFAAMADALDGSLPLFVRVRDAESARSAVAWGQTRKLRIVLVGGEGLASCAEFLALAEVPVIVMGTHRLPSRRDDAYDTAFGLPAVLAKAKVRFAIAGEGSYANERNLPYHAATAVAFGLSRAAAERAITLDAATILGVADRVGSLAEGKDATMFLAEGDPMDVISHVRRAWI